MSQNKEKEKLNRKKKAQNDKDGSPSGEITLEEVVEISEDQKQTEDEANKNDSSDNSSEKDIQ